MTIAYLYMRYLRNCGGRPFDGEYYMHIIIGIQGLSATQRYTLIVCAHISTKKASSVLP